MTLGPQPILFSFFFFSVNLLILYEPYLTAEQCDIKLQCVTTPLKGRGMVSPTDILPASLIHREEPLAAV